jgi:hypothetical protein
LLTLFVFHYANISFFYHSHTINGLLISHSHVHNSDHAKNGTHTVGEFSLISILSDFQSSKAATGLVGIGLFLLCLAILRLDAENKLVSAIPCHSHLRGPPAFF